MKQSPEELVQKYQSTIKTIRNDIYQILGRRYTNDDTRFCVWNGQSADGRKHEIDMNEKALPFEGASDARIRTCDKIINERVSQIVLAATRVSPKVKGVTSNSDNRAGKMAAIIRWLKDNKWGSDFRDQIELLAQYIEGDTPAAALLWVDWVKEKAIKIEGIDTDGLMKILVDAMGEEMTDDVMVDTIKILNDPAREPEFIALLQKQFPNLSNGTAKKISKDLRDTNKAEFPLPYLRKDMPVIKARRLFDDVFLRPNMREFLRCPEVIDREWLSRPGVKERSKTEGWDQKFTDELLGEEYEDNGFTGIHGKEGMSAWEDSSYYLASKTNSLVDVEPRRGLYEVLTIYEYKTDDDGCLGIWKTTFSGYVQIPAKMPELFKRKHGRFPYVLFTRENVRARKLDSRGVGELAQTHQNMQKLVHDAFADHVQAMTNPPLKVLQGRTKFQVTLAPFGQIEQGPRENVEFLQRPPFPQATEEMINKLNRDVDEYFGRPNKELDPSIALLHDQARIDRFLAYLKDVYEIVIQLCQEFMDDEHLEKIVGHNGMPIARSVDEIQGQYELSLSFDVRDLNMDFIKDKAKMYVEVIKQLDTKATVQWDHAVKRLMDAIDPFDSDAMVIDSGVANDFEIEDEKLNYAKMISGIEPKMTEGAINAQARIQVIQEENQKRQQFPQMFAPVSPASMKIIDNRMKYLSFQIQQQQNAITGRMGTEPLSPQDLQPEMNSKSTPPTNVPMNPNVPAQPIQGSVPNMGGATI